MSSAAHALANGRERLIVGISEIKVSADPEMTIITYALGSCLGLALYDPVARVGGMLHAMLPKSEIDPVKAQANPHMFVDTGIPALFRALYQLGAKKERVVAKAAGCAALNMVNTDQFEIGKRNLLMMRQLFWKNNVLLHAQDVGGNVSRTLSLDVGSGEVRIRSNGQDTVI